MKKYFFTILVLLLLPVVVSAKTVSDDHFNLPGDDATEVIIQTFEPGDIIEFKEIAENLINIDDVDEEGCFGTNSGCSRTYKFTKSVIYEGSRGRGILKFMSIDKNTKIISVDDLVDGHIYTSGDIIAFPHINYEMNYYDSTGELITNRTAALVGKIEQYNDKDITWKLSILGSTNYAPISLGFQVFNYIKPTFKLACDKTTLSYGEKTGCAVSAISQYQLKEVAFSLDLPNFKISNPKASNHITMSSNNNKYKFQVENGYGNNNIEFRIMTFDVESTKNGNYIDDIKISDLSYSDDLYEGDYDTIQNNIKVTPSSSLKNPNTYRNAILILLPFLILGISLIIIKVENNMKKKI